MLYLCLSFPRISSILQLPRPLIAAIPAHLPTMTNPNLIHLIPYLRVEYKNVKHIVKGYHTSEKQRMRFEGKIPLHAFFTLSIVGKMILMDGLFTSWLAFQQPHCQKHKLTAKTNGKHPYIVQANL